MSPGGFEQLRAECAAGPPGPLHIADVLCLPQALREFVLWLIREGPVDAAEVAERLGRAEPDGSAFLAELLERSLVIPDGAAGSPRFRLNLISGKR